MKKYRIVGINDDQDSCLCCGRTGLKRVVWMIPLDVDGNADGTPEHYGTSCAARIAGYAYPTSAAAKRKIESAAWDAAYKTIQEHIDKIRKENCMLVFRSESPVGRFYIGKDRQADYQSGAATIAECIESLRQQFPVMRYLDGKLSIGQAISFIIA